MYRIKNKKKKKENEFLITYNIRSNVKRREGENNK